MKKFYLFVLIVFSTLFAFAQSFSIDWVRTADSYLKSGSMIARDHLDNVIATGYTTSSSIYTQKYDRFGNFKWERSSSSDIHSNYEKGLWVNTDAQNNVYVTGYRYTISSQPPYEFPNAIIVLKYDPDGNLLWKFILPGSFGLTIAYSYSPLKFRSEIDANGNLYVGTSGIITGNSVAGFVLVKINQQGNMVWNRTHNFSTQHGFFSMRLKKDLIVLTGSSEIYNHNVSSVMYDTSGNEKWAATTSEYFGGKDVELDDVGNSYILTGNYNEVNPTSGADIVVLKYNSSGNQVTRKKYDFSGEEFPTKLCLTGTNQIGVIGYGTFGSGIIVDWLVMKLNTNGGLLWSKTSVNSGPYDVFPVNLIGNSKGELFVTGTKPSGNPFPGYLALGTNKYLADGTTGWSTLYDSTASNGIALTPASDGSLYVLGASFATVIHYFDHTGTGTCGITDTARAVNITKNAAVIEHPKNVNAFVYHIQYKASTSPVWITISTDKARFKLTGLTPGTTYDYRVEDVCNSGPSGYISARQFTTLGSGYCSTGGLNSTADWIDLVWLGSIQSGTGNNNGYADLTYLTTKAAPGATVSGYLSASYGAGNHNEFFRVWVDFNIDGDFDDPGEKVIDTSTTSIGWIVSSFVVPANAKTGTTRMRVSMENLSAPLPCGTYAAGETEDYGFVIQNAAATSVNTFTGLQINQSTLGSFAIAPNPANNQVNIQHEFNNAQPVYLTVYNATGTQVISKVLSGNKLDVSKLSNGLYVVQLIQNNIIKRTKLLIQR
ncbi:MAG TPA: GEVED domain-containing protein [Panacibacter sp.]|nr:GEVED domain-containing protein [Panacibacter sp.]